MAEIPSNLASSAAQSGVQSREIARGREATRANTSAAADRQVKAVDEAGSTVDTEDADNRVFADSEGGGSQGRSFEEGKSAQSEESKDACNNGITTDDQGRLHLDLEA